MRFFSLALALLAGFAGLYLGVRVYKNFGVMTRGEILPGTIVRNSISAGVAGFLIFFALVMMMGFLDESYDWTITKFYGAIGFSLIPAGIITIGSFLQSIVIIGYRKILHDHLRQEDKHK